MASPHKLALIVNKIPLEPVDYYKTGKLADTRRFLTPVRFRQITLKPKKLPKIIPNETMKGQPHSLSDFLTAFSASKEIVHLESLLQSKIKLNIVQNKHYGYIKSSARKKMQETIKTRSRQDSPIHFFQKVQEVETVNKHNPKMVDATFNTDFELIN